jgi:hypothetical protein
MNHSIDIFSKIGYFSLTLALSLNFTNTMKQRQIINFTLIAHVQKIPITISVLKSIHEELMNIVIKNPSVEKRVQYLRELGFDIVYHCCPVKK